MKIGSAVWCSMATAPIVRRRMLSGTFGITAATMSLTVSERWLDARPNSEINRM